MVALVLGIVWPLPQHPPHLSLVPPRDPDDESLEDAMMDIAAAGRKKYVNPCALVKEPACPANRDAGARPCEDQEDDAAPGEFPDGGDWPF
jgi:hypothetical protein